jgi:predicted nucleotidyltransferase
MATAVMDDNLRLLLATIREVVAPERVYLFGSRARGTADADSDYDLLAVVGDRRPARDLRLAVRRRLAESGIAFDLAIQTRDEFERWSRLPSTLSGIVADSGVLLDG